MCTRDLVVAVIALAAVGCTRATVVETPKLGQPVTALGCHPGVAATELMRHAGPFRVFTPVFGMLLNTAAQGAWPSLQAATGEAKHGGYYGPQGTREMKGPSGEASRTQQAEDKALARRS